MPDTLKITWEGADGSVWDLMDRRAPVRAVAFTGMGMPKLTNLWEESAAYDGMRYAGTTWGANNLTMSVVVGDEYIPDGFTQRRWGDDWRILDRQWRESLSAEAEGRLVVESAAGGRRWLNLRLENPVAPPPDINPGWRGVARYDLDLTAGDEPWWLGTDVTEEFEWSLDDQPFFGGDAGDVLLYISPSSGSDLASISNPGDRAGWPRWWAQGPFQAVTVGVGGKLVTLPFPLRERQRVYVDSQLQTITDGAGANLWPLMGYSDPLFAPIPAGKESVPLLVRFVSPEAGATAGVALTPRYHGPW